HQQVLSKIMLANIIDNQQSFDILADGTSRRRTPRKDEKLFNAQEYFMSNVLFFLSMKIFFKLLLRI
ncbi:MAG: hypothetical protein PV354_01320, partial [Bartonella sp.]|nr:hypothetical protein [Bartonella sp.]